MLCGCNLCYCGVFITQIAPTSTNDSMKVLRLVTNTWNMWYCTEQTQPVFAPPLPAPRQVFNQLQYRTGVLVQTIHDCSSFQVIICSMAASYELAQLATTFDSRSNNELHFFVRAVPNYHVLLICCWVSAAR